MCDIGGKLGFKKKRSSGSSESEIDRTQTERLQIDEAGIQKIIDDVLGGAGGLADIFAGEQTAGVFDSSVAAQAAGDLAANLVGEIAKLTATRETRTVGTAKGKTKGKSSEFSANLGLSL